MHTLAIVATHSIALITQTSLTRILLIGGLAVICIATGVTGFMIWRGRTQTTRKNQKYARQDIYSSSNGGASWTPQAPDEAAIMRMNMQSNPWSELRAYEQASGKMRALSRSNPSGSLQPINTTGVSGQLQPVNSVPPRVPPSGLLRNPPTPVPFTLPTHPPSNPPTPIPLTLPMNQPSNPPMASPLNPQVAVVRQESPSTPPALPLPPMSPPTPTPGRIPPEVLNDPLVQTMMRRAQSGLFILPGKRNQS